jgi:molybdopterin-guanine dinucleotide biosynthesis protein B
MDKKKPVAFAIVGAHNSGKTTFIEAVIKILKQRGYKVVAVKHDPKGKAKTDTEGKDSWKFQKAGADQVILVSPTKITVFTKVEEELSPLQIIEKFADKNIDFIILEGFKWFKGFDKFEVIRKEEGRKLLLEDDPELKGVITDYLDFPLKFDINNPEEFVDYIEKNY